MSHEMEPKNHAEQINALWQESCRAGVINDLKELDPQMVIEQNYSPERKPHKRIIRCADGRCLHNGEEASLAGSGMLMSEEAFAKFMQENPDIEEITSHADCGAAKIAFSNAEKNNSLPEGVTNPAEYAVYWAKQKAAEYNLKYSHIDEASLVNEHHHEGALVVVADKDFHPTQVSQMPNSFVSDAAVVDRNYAAQEAGILAGIALGDHGFGKRFTPDQPFYIMVAAKDEVSKEDLVSRINETVTQYGDRVKVKGFTVPGVKE